MKRLLTLFILLAFLAALAGCVSIGWGGRGPGVRGTGPMTSSEHEVGEYDVVDIRGIVKVVYSSDPSTKVRLDIQENLREYMILRVENSTLVVDSERDIFVSSLDETPVLYVYRPSLRAVFASGGISMTGSDAISGDTFTLEVSGAGEVDLALDVNSLITDMSGAGDVTLRGRADNMDASISGAGGIDALELQTRRARVEMSGAGSAKVNCSEDLTVSISGVGNLEYRGNPSVHPSISGIGNVKQVD